MQNVFPTFFHQLKEKATIPIFSHIFKNRNFYVRIMEVDSGVFLEQCLIAAYDIATDRVDTYSASVIRKLGIINTEVYRVYINHAISSVVIYWIRNDMQIPVEMIAGDLWLMIEYPLSHIRDYYLP